MKTKFTYTLSIFLLSAFSSFGSTGFTGNLLFTAKLDGAQETPAVSTAGMGLATFALNSNRDTMSINAIVKGLSGAITAAHIHQGKVGIAGSTIIPLTSFVSGNKITTILTGANLTNDIISNFLNGTYYINVHTAANPNGEIRGQILLETDNQYSANMNGAQETPAVSTGAEGLAVFSLYKTDSILSVFTIVHGLSGPITAAHLHNGAPGIAGPVIANLTSGVSGKMISIDVNPRAFLSDLLAGNIYINVHTAMNPNGEIRGQLVTDMKLDFDVSLDGASETPAIVSNAKGTGTIKINSKMDTLWYDVLFDGISAMPTSAHFHEAEKGVPGSVVINLSSNIINDHRITGMITGTALTKNFINKMMEGKIYINIHTPLHPDGEIRGQVERLAREGLTYRINTAQETPSFSSTAIGAGFVSIDREKENLHFMVLVEGLTGPATSAHFHNAIKGVSGPVIFDLSPFFSGNSSNDTASGFWTDEDTTPFTESIADLFLSNQVYFNIHTSAYPNGEARGQVMLGDSSFHSIITNIEKSLSMDDRLNIFPNPGSDDLTLAFNATEIHNATLKVCDLLGRQMIIKNIVVLNDGNKISLDITQLESGIYTVLVDFPDGEMMCSKFIKQ